MQLDSYISDLLYRYECVTIPGFGAFLSHRISARIDADSQTFFPPQKRLSFNKQLQENDGLLANYISKAEEISYADALKRIQTYTRQILISLESDGSVTLEKIGSLSRNAEGNISFEPVQNINYLTDAFGLASYAAKPVYREVYKKEVAELEQKAPIALTPERRSSGWLKYAAVGLLAIGIAGSLGYLHLQNVEDHNFAAKQQAETELENQIQQATFTIENPLPAVTLNVLKPKGKYHIVAGAFRVPENATSRVEELREKGFKARLIGENKYGLHQVVYGSFSDRLEALEELRKVRNSDNAAAWMLVEELD